MYWEDTAQEPRYTVPEDIIDLSFRVRCRCLPANYAAPLETALATLLPWFADEPLAGIYMAYGAEFGNGWARQSGGDALVHLSSRARLNLRLPKTRIRQAAQLEGRSIDILGHRCDIGSSKTRLLSTHGTLFTRHLSPVGCDEEAFLENAAHLLGELGIRPPKMLAGLSRVIDTPRRKIETRSLMVDGLKPQESVLLQQHGLGKGRTLGCGLFLPHKSISAIDGKPAG